MVTFLALLDPDPLDLHAVDDLLIVGEAIVSSFPVLLLVGGLLNEDQVPFPSQATLVDGGGLLGIVQGLLVPKPVAPRVVIVLRNPCLDRLQVWVVPFRRALAPLEVGAEGAVLQIQAWPGTALYLTQLAKGRPAMLKATQETAIARNLPPHDMVCTKNDDSIVHVKSCGSLESRHAYQLGMERHGQRLDKKTLQEG